MAENQASAPTTEELLAQLAAAKEVIAQQANTISELDAQKGSANPVVTVEKVKYEVVCPAFTHTDGKKYTAEEVKKNADLAKELVEMGSGVLVKVEASKK